MLSSNATPHITRVILDEQPWYTADDGAIAREIASPRNAPLETLSIADIRIPPDTIIEPHHHEGMEEVYWIAGGRGIMEIEGATFEVSQGDAIVILSHERHDIRNPFPEELRLHVYCNPPWAPEELYFEPLPENERPGAPQQSRVFPLDGQPWTEPAPGVQHRWMAAPENTPLSQLAIAEWRLAPGTQHAVSGAEDMENVYFVFSGALSVEIDGEEHHFEALQAAVIAPGKAHTIANPSTKPLHLHHYSNRPR